MKLWLLQRLPQLTLVSASTSWPEPLNRLWTLTCLGGITLAGTMLLALFPSKKTLITAASLSAEERLVDSLLAQMTVEEKIGQMTLFTTDWESTGPTIREGYREDIRRGRCGALFNSHTVAFTRELQRIAVEESRLKIPLLFGYDVIHGYKTIFPIPLAEAASWDLEAIERSARIAATEAAAAGLHWTFAPMVDISRDPRWGRVMEGAGEDPWWGSRVAEARVRGFQGKGLGHTDAVAACVKHYAAYGAPTAGREYNTVDMSERFFREYYLPPYAAAVRAGAATVMTAFNDYDGVPATGNRYLLTDVLRRELGFEGFVVTDYTAINEMVPHGFARDEQEAGELALHAGVDMDMQGAVFQRFLKRSLEEGKVSMAQIDTAVRRILRLKYRLGLFENPYKFCDPAREKRLLLSAEHRAAARDMARKSIVLLKNEKKVLPLSRTARIALIGPLADNRNDLIGAWSAAGSGSDCVSLLEGLRAASKGVVWHAKGCDLEGNDRRGFAEAVALAKRADVVLVAVGESAAMSGEAASRARLSLPGVQEALIEALAATGKPVVVVLMNGRPLAIPNVVERATALVEAWWLGTEAGNALADVLFGDYNPSGKLPMTFPRTEGQIPIFYNEKSTGRPFDPNSKWTSKYIDVPNSPLFPFGFGLSYTTFEYSPPTVSRRTFRLGDTLYVSATVRNTGDRAGTEVVQLYVRDLVGSVTRPVRELKGIQRIYLQPGESRLVTFALTEADLRFYRRDMTFGSEPGEFDLFISSHSAHGQPVRVELQ
ncbi:MAG: glycoside hydrolase family 3 C-terminal domain-containing protein [Saprospiraceae bacterium]|nr:glycoside hydrolase family 3 C-terminal domain-containing protein [Saprospiraceae bacterium]MDW8485318.1 glycoside hydrolase family 3 N-terminal domain-containing protein [Saprospiraceae bacterium]